jgi:hypothetical protein
VQGKWFLREGRKVQAGKAASKRSKAKAKANAFTASMYKGMEKVCLFPYNTFPKYNFLYIIISL